MIRAAVITFPGSNCDDDLVYALKSVLGFEVSTIWHKDRVDFAGYQLVALPGGFSYGDYLRSGAMAARAPIMADVRAFAEKGGLVLGVCNGFQVLCEAGLLPGALIRNEKLKFVCEDVQLVVQSNETAWTGACKARQELTIPIAHGDGRYFIGAEEYETAKANGQVLLTYKNNPNGSAFDIAGISNAKKNVFGLMPHPERSTDLRGGDGRKIFESILHYVKESVARG